MYTMSICLPIHPSTVHPSFHVCFVCILCMSSMYVSGYSTVCACYVCIWCMHTVCYVYYYILLSVYTLYVNCVSI